MKRFTKSFIMLLMLFCVLSLSSMALEWVFDNPAVAQQWTFNHATAAVEADGLKITPSGNDVYMMCRIPEPQRVDSETHPYIAIVQKINTIGDTGSIFFGNSNLQGPKGPENSPYKFSGNGEWESVIVDMSSYPHKLWNGRLMILRLDVIQTADLNADITISRIGVFASREEAEAFIFADPAMANEKERIEAEKAALEEQYKNMESPTWIFDSEEKQNEWIFSGVDHTMGFGFFYLTPVTWDPIMTYTFPSGERMPASEFKFFALRIKTAAQTPGGAMFFSNDKYPGFSDAGYIAFDIDKTDWTNVIVDMSEKFPERWVGNVDTFRIDPINVPQTYTGNDPIFLDRCGFFRTKEEAEAFLAEGRSELDFSLAHTIAMPMFKVTIPGGTIKETYNEKNFVISDTGEGGNVVMFTDKEGNTSPVALSYINKGGFTTYIANKDGSYKIGTSSKSFVDTDGHWALENIDFVASRALFGGTSPTEFSPEETMTRGMFITVLGRMHGVDTAKYDGNTGYTDVPADMYYAPYIQWAKEMYLAPAVSDKEFAPEEPITRKDMALITANYMKAYDYTVKMLDKVDSFNDIDSFSDAEKDAMILMQKAGIINGKGEGKFDPNGISTRAEVATVMQRVIKSILDVNVLSPYSPEYFSRDRLRLSAWSYTVPMWEEENFKNYVDIGFDTLTYTRNGGILDTQKLFAMADMHGIEMFTGEMPAKEGETGDPIAMNAPYFENYSFRGSYLGDEPGTTEYDWLAAHANSYIEKLPGKVPFINLLPMYANDAQLKYNAGAAAIEYYDPNPDFYREYCDQFCEKFNTDYICVDIYPLHANKTYTDYVESINQVASSAREHGKEFWCCIQALKFSDGMRTPALNEYYWQCYSMLSFGCTHLIWWKYEGKEGYPSLLNHKNEPTQSYYDTQKVVAEMKALSDTYIQYKNLGAFTLNCTDATPYLKMTNEYTEFDVLSEITCDQPLLVGCFDKKEGEGNAFTVVNMSELLDNKTATVKFKTATDATVTSYKGGNATVLTPVDGYYTVTLDCGMGEFLTIE